MQKNKQSIILTHEEVYGFGTQAMMKVKVCPTCHNASSVSEQFCKECGAKLPKETVYQTYKKQSRYCSVCDTVVNTTAQYCPKCGTKLKKGGNIK